ncbi:T7SS effector LXG polymorphic toxin [Bacillus haynesii]|uniref:ribonuclease YeeF family protein n=1 Tax=Bacillus haynesii TaxID=1925021 RepID=UPI002DBC5134|nr:T7SS effector LXG polymorphic toxin [Bacillus haynesii]MEC0633371.1 T7SS effector LXG polymorphic toxin [Bacillus haynesii]MEC1653453.1 T7SS effector LXG polymorphic toxin [Bacillus haynesii]
MKILESSSLVEAANKRKKEYEAFEEQLQTLKKAFLGVADLGDDFQGKGADNIKDFFRGQAEIVDSWLKLVDAQIAFFKGVSGDIKDQKLSNSYVEVSFLDHELKNADLKATEIVSGLKLEMDKIIASISDIVDLDNWTLDDYIDKMGKAQETRQNTIDAVNKLDESLKTEYSNLEALDNAVLAKYSGLMEATSHGKNAAPMHFSLKSFHSSEIYKNTMEVEKQATNYIDFKNEQTEARRLQEKQEEEANKPWYLKALDAGGTFLGEISGYYDYKRAADGVDPITGEKLTDGQRVAAGGMAAAGYIPIIGWAGKIAKGGKAIYSTSKAMHAADKALDAYKTTKTFQGLKNAEKGLYGLAAANGFSETIIGRDMFGNKISDEQRKDSLNHALSMLGAYGLRGVNTKLNVKNSEVSKRPSWRQSEVDVGKDYPGYKDQVSFKDRIEVTHGTKNSSRPDFYNKGHSIEVKNYKLSSSSGRSNLVRVVSDQFNKRVKDLPEGTKQTVIIDVRGQQVSREILRDVKRKIDARTGNKAEIIFKMD